MRSEVRIEEARKDYFLQAAMNQAKINNYHSQSITFSKGTAHNITVKQMTNSDTEKIGKLILLAPKESERLRRKNLASDSNKS